MGDLKKVLLCSYASGTLNVQEHDSLDATSKKLVDRQNEIDRLMASLRAERNAITTALSIAGIRPPVAHKTIYNTQENEYWREQPFKSMSLTDSCLKVLRDSAEHEDIAQQWLNKNEVEYLVTRGGFVFKTEDPTNSVNVSLRRLAEDGYCEAHGGKGSRGIRYHFVRERLPDELNSRATKDTKSGES